MKRFVAVVAVVVAAGVGYLWCRQSPEEPRAPAPVEQSRPVERGVPMPVDESSHPETRRPTLPRPSPSPRPSRTFPPFRDSAPSGPVERVDFDRRPWDPQQEIREKYEHRAELFEAFDRFVEETGMSEERAQALLMLMYDFQETVRLLDEELWSQWPYRDKWQFEFQLRKHGADWQTVMFDTDEQLYAMLSPEELRAWRRTLEEARVWEKLSAGVVFGRLIRPVEAS